MESAQQHDSKQASPAPVSFKPALLGAGLLFSVFLNAIRFFSEHGTGATPSLHPFAVYAGWGLTGAGIVLAALAMLAKRADRRTPDLTRTAPLVTGACLVAIGVQFMLPLYTQLTLPFAEPAMFGLAFGAGLAMLATAWGSVFARLEPENLLFNSAWGIVAAAVVHFAAEPLSPSPIGLALIACSLVTSVALLFVARTFNDETAAPHPAGAESASEDDHRIRLRKAAAILWMPLVGACITCFIFGLTWDPVISSEQMRLPDPLGAWKSLIGPSLLAIVVALFVLRKANSSPLRLLNQAVYPIAVALLLALPVISSDSDVAAGIIDVLTQASFAVLALAIWCSMASAVRSVPFAATFVFPACLALLALAFVAGLCGIAVIGTDGRTICLIMLTVYLALIAISFAQGSRQREGRRTEPHGADDSRTYIHRRCDTLAAERGLSPREREVLYYLGRGYNHGYVAEKLYISENTVRTHVRHIYAKLAINSREELLAMIDDETPRG